MGVTLSTADIVVSLNYNSGQPGKREALRWSCKSSGRGSHRSAGTLPDVQYVASAGANDG